MPFCPKCKSEYRSGVEDCADCNVSLVKELPLEGDLVLFCPAEDSADVRRVLDEAGIQTKSAALRPEEGDPIEARLCVKNIEASWRLARRFQDLDIPETEEPQWVTIFRGDLSQAEALRGALESAGIEAQVPDEDVYSVDPSERLKADILVAQADLKAAQKVLQGMDRIDESAKT